MKHLRNNDAISQIIGEIFLLAIAVTAVSVIAMQVLSTPGPQDTTTVTIIGKIEWEHPVFEIQRGESLGPDSTIKIIINNRTEDRNAPPQPLSNYISSFNSWNIGEQIINQTYVWDPDPQKSLQVEATIVDTKTNAIVFWGIIPGRTTGHLGGLWHFDEDLWNISRYDVNDSSGNNNNGTAEHDARIIKETEQPEDVIYENFGEFKESRDQYVLVNTSVSLNITEKITIEAWMKPKDLPSILDYAHLLDQFGYTPYIIHGVGDIYVIVSEDTGKIGKLATVPIDSEGNIDIDSYNMFIFQSVPGGGQQFMRPMVTQINDTMYLISYNDKDNYMHLKTFNISTDGSIITYTGPQNDVIYTDHECSSIYKKPNRATVQKITDNDEEVICAIAYWAPNYGGILRTIGIDLSTGKITNKTMAPVYDPQSGEVTNPCLCLVNATNNMYALAYSNASDQSQGIIKTIFIYPSGDISYTGNMVEFETESAYEPCLIRVSEEKDIFAVAYRDQNEHGWVDTRYIYSNGLFGKLIDTKEFETGLCHNPCLIQCEEDMYYVAYSTAFSGTSTGFCMPLEIDNEGIIDLKITLRQEIIVNKPHCVNPILIHISGRLCALVFEGQGNHPGQLITMYLLAEDFGPYRGIFKKDSYGIYANTSTVVGSINNVMVIYNDLSPDTWYHFAVTYDYKTNYITLYIHNAMGAPTVPPILKYYPDHHLISRTPEDLYLGRNYNGYIDEILIYDVALTEGQIQNHVSSRLISEDDLFN